MDKACISNSGQIKKVFVFDAKDFDSLTINGGDLSFATLISEATNSLSKQIFQANSGTLYIRRTVCKSIYKMPRIFWKYFELKLKQQDIILTDDLTVLRRPIYRMQRIA